MLKDILLPIEGASSVWMSSKMSFNFTDQVQLNVTSYTMAWTKENHHKYVFNLCTEVVIVDKLKEHLVYS